jgi:hypothetical protein
MSDTPKPIGPGSFESLIWLDRMEATDLIEVIGKVAKAAENADDLGLWVALAEHEAILTDKLVNG